VEQISIFLENKPGGSRLTEGLRTRASNPALSLADTAIWDLEGHRGRREQAKKV
jgi:hypothetical protein